MPWIYESSTGLLHYSEDIFEEGSLVAKGYSGRKGYKNNTSFDHLKNTGPIPPGRYTIGLARNDPSSGKRKGLGPLVMNLDPLGHNAFGRTHFRIHGDNAKNDASEGCIILPPDVRKKIAKSSDKELIVVRRRKK